MLEEDVITENGLKDITSMGKKFYYAKVKTKYGSHYSILDENLNQLKTANTNKDDKIEEEIHKMAKHKYGMKATFKNLVFEDVAHKDYYESDQAKIQQAGYPGFPCQRRGSMKDLFYNTESKFLFNEDVFKIVDFCKNKKEYTITFKNKSDKYILHSFQFTTEREIHQPSAFFLVRKSIYNKFKDNILDLFEDADDDSYHKELYIKEEHSNDAIFLVHTSAVTNALDALFDGNKHMLKGYQNKKITIR